RQLIALEHRLLRGGSAAPRNLAEPPRHRPRHGSCYTPWLTTSITTAVREAAEPSLPSVAAVPRHARPAPPARWTHLQITEWTLLQRRGVPNGETKRTEGHSCPGRPRRMCVERAGAARHDREDDRLPTARRNVPQCDVGDHARRAGARDRRP